MSDRDWLIAEVTVARRHRVGIACGRDSGPRTDPVAVNYRNACLAHIESLLDIAAAVLAPGDRVLDLGAHLGGFALTASALGCKVLAVEASPRNAELLRISAEHNKFADLEIVHAAVSDERGTVAFEGSGPWGHVARPDEDGCAATLPSVRVDDLLAERVWNGVRFVKLDVEGSEIRAIRGMPNLLGRADAPMIFFESNTHTLGFYGHTEHDLRRELSQLGFKLYEVRSKVLVVAGDGDAQAKTCTDYLAAKELPDTLAKRVRHPAPSAVGRLAQRILWGA